MITVLDGYSRYVVHFDLRESMTEVDVKTVCQAAIEKHPGVKPRIISDNGPQFIAKDFKAFVKFHSMTHVKTSPYYRQSNGKLERFTARSRRSASVGNALAILMKPCRRFVRTFFITTRRGFTVPSAT